MVEQSQQNIARDRHLFGDHPKRILSLDGGGVRGLITLGMLKRVESLLKSRSTAGAHFRLCQYFDLIGGTSTGAIIATMLAMGLTVDRIIALYFDMIPKIFGAPRPVGGLIYPKFDPETFDRIIQQVFDEILRDDLERPDLVDRPDRLTHPRLDSNVLQTGLAIFAKRADTNSVWPVTNNPRSKYWTPDGPFWQNRPPEQREDFFPNRDYSLRQIVRASASAPYYLDAIEIDVGPGQTGFFLDGGV
ncbi:MAG: patatin-like phospholipase family protein, partial [Hyphomicrobiaceae bacterium]